MILLLQHWFNAEKEKKKKICEYIKNSPHIRTTGPGGNRTLTQPSCATEFLCDVDPCGLEALHKYLFQENR